MLQICKLHNIRKSYQYAPVYQAPDLIPPADRKRLRLWHSGCELWKNNGNLNLLSKAVRPISQPRRGPIEAGPQSAMVPWVLRYPPKNLIRLMGWAL